MNSPAGNAGQPLKKYYWTVRQKILSVHDVLQKILKKFFLFHLFIPAGLNQTRLVEMLSRVVAGISPARRDRVTSNDRYSLQSRRLIK